MNTWVPSLLAGLFSILALIPARAGQIEDALLAGAAARLDVKGTELAIRRGANVTAPLPHPDAPDSKKTPVQFAILALIGAKEADAPQRAERMLRALFKAGAKLTGDRDELFVPISYGYERIITLLLDQGANPHARIYGYTPAELSIKYGHQKLLPLFYARSVPKIDEKTTAQIDFVHAASRQQLNDMQSAIENGAEVDAPDPAGSIAIVQLFTMPLIEPIGYNSLKWLLTELNADVTAVELSEEKSTALHKLIERNSFRQADYFTTSVIAEALLDRGAEVSAIDYLGRTPLHYAAKYGNILTARVLVRSGAKVMARDMFGKTPIDLAKSGEVISLLRAAGARE